MFKRGATGLCAVLFILFFSGCSARTEIEALSQLSSRSIGAQTGTASDQYILKRFPDAKIVYFPNTNDGVVALKTDKIDAFASVTIDSVVVAVLYFLVSGMLIRIRSLIEVQVDPKARRKASATLSSIRRRALFYTLCIAVETR